MKKKYAKPTLLDKLKKTYWRYEVHTEMKNDKTIYIIRDVADRYTPAEIIKKNAYAKKMVWEIVGNDLHCWEREIDDLPKTPSSIKERTKMRMTLLENIVKAAAIRFDKQYVKSLYEIGEPDGVYEEYENAIQALKDFDSVDMSARKI